MKREQVLVACVFLLVSLWGAGAVLGQEIAAGPDAAPPAISEASSSPGPTDPGPPSSPITPTQPVLGLPDLGALTLAEERPATATEAVPGVDEVNRAGPPDEGLAPAAQSPSAPASVVTVNTTSVVVDGSTASIADLIANPARTARSRSPKPCWPSTTRDRATPSPLPCSPARPSPSPAASRRGC